MIVGLTGGIGSGKTTAAGFFENLGIPIYIADDRAKLLMNNSENLKTQILELLGKEAYTSKGLNRPYIAGKVFDNKDLLAGLNAIVHPAVEINFIAWYKEQNAPYVIKEAAILFENAGYKKCDYMVVVTAPLKMRLQRVSKRDKLSTNEILDRIKNQWTDARKISLADAVLKNSTLTALESQVLRLHKHLIIKVSRGR